MKKTVILFGLALAAAALAQYKVVFGGKTTGISGVVANGKLSLSSKPYAGVLGSSVSIDFKAKSASFTRNGKTAKVTVSIQKDIAYAPAVDVAKGLGLSASVSSNTITITNPTPAVPSNAPSVQGTSQQNGGDGVIGQAYTLCKGGNAINYQITKLEYSVGDYLYDGGNKNDILAPDKKALIIYFTVQNPQKTEIDANGNRIRFSGVDSKNQNVSSDGYWYEQGTLREVSSVLRPAQKRSAFTRIVLDNDVSLPKLIVDDCNNAVWRYDLRDKVAPVPAPFADPSVPDGSSALKIFPAQFGTYYPGRTNFRLDKLEYSTAPWFDGSNPPEGGKWLIVYFTVQNPTKQAQSLGQSALSFLDQDGVESSQSGWVYRASRDTGIGDIQLPANQEIQLRALVEVPAGAEVKKIRLTWDYTRTAELDASSLK
jgi:hypothetical protein